MGQDAGRHHPPSFLTSPVSAMAASMMVVPYGHQSVWKLFIRLVGCKPSPSIQAGPQRDRWQWWCSHQVTKFHRTGQTGHCPGPCATSNLPTLGGFERLHPWQAQRCSWGAVRACPAGGQILCFLPCWLSGPGLLGSSIGQTCLVRSWLNIIFGH